MAELTAYCLAKQYAREAKDWYLMDACNVAIARKSLQIALEDR